MWVWGSGLNIPLVSPPSLLLSHLNVHIINAHFALSHRNLTETYQSWMFEYTLTKVVHFHILFWAKLFKLHRAESFFLILLTFYSNLCRESPSNLKSIMPSTYKYDKIVFKRLSKHRHWRNSFSRKKTFFVCWNWLDCRKVTDISINVMLLNFSLHSISPACDALLEWNLKGTYLEQYNCSDSKSHKNFNHIIPFFYWM